MLEMKFVQASPAYVQLENVAYEIRGLEPCKLLRGEDKMAQARHGNEYWNACGV